MSKAVLRRINRFLNTTEMRWSDKWMAMHIAIGFWLARRFQASNDEITRLQGDALAVMASERKHIADQVHKMYEKYIDRTIPSALIARDMIRTWPGDDLISYQQWLRRAVAYPEEVENIEEGDILDRLFHLPSIH